ncbi:hypothetical protein PC129_g3422 [Phytophthora cactorum]|nr:hypothetical protein Pcac1_g16534 [Phytophthora cactorum]KAG2835885.1 hypothetical protein PC112_g5466 [Phytophthora cactorum]KAG2846838.1 hypothetical protein PC111_g1043 [Phytophthora cactorum]KAG2921600.1 hypothetical protein PC114_g5649 [Phytophthora cactorum]KAG2942774.1 hypothetical protein PC115_g1262 [Phytophthora cactorum]
MAAFGRMIFLILAQYREDTCFDALEKPPIVQPDFLSGNEWNLLHVLWNADPTEEGCMSNAVERMKYLVKMEKIQNQQDRKINESWSESLSSFSVGGSVVDDIETYVISTADMTLTEALNEVGEALLEGDALVETDGLYIAYSDSRSVYNRVVDLKEQLFAYTRPLPAMLIDTYAMIVWDLYKILDSMNDDAHSIDEYVCDFASSLHPAVSITSQIYALQSDLDKIISSSSGILSNSKVHWWRSAYASLEPSATMSSISLNCLVGVPRDRSTLFVPMEEVRRTYEIDRGAFGSVHCAEWL